MKVCNTVFGCNINFCLNIFGNNIHTVEVKGCACDNRSSTNNFFGNNFKLQCCCCRQACGINHCQFKVVLTREQGKHRHKIGDIKQQLCFARYRITYGETEFAKNFGQVAGVSQVKL